MITIDDFHADYIEVCARVMAENALWQRYGVTQSSAETLFRTSAQDERAIIKVAQEGKQICGFIWFYLQGTFYSGGYIRLIGVANAAKGRGTGQMLMEAAEMQIRQHTRDVFLLTSDFNLDAQRFYQRLGYQSIGALPEYVLPGITEVIFWKRFIQ